MAIKMNGVVVIIIIIIVDLFSVMVLNFSLEAILEI